MRLTLYVAVIPKMEDLFRLKLDPKSLALCYLCMAKWNSFCLTEIAELQALSGTELILERHGNASSKNKMKAMLKLLLVLPATSVFQTLLRVRTNPSVSVYAVFTVEPMHLLSLGIRRTLKEYVINILSDKT